MTTPEPQPCPFCGGLPRVYTYMEDDGTPKHAVSCDHPMCPAFEVTAIAASEAEVTAAWNTRPLEDALRSRLSALENAQTAQRTWYDVEARAAAAERERDTLRAQLAKQMFDAAPWHDIWTLIHIAGSVARTEAQHAIVASVNTWHTANAPQELFRKEKR